MQTVCTSHAPKDFSARSVAAYVEMGTGTFD